jgi:hypothetical protein
MNRNLLKAKAENAAAQEVVDEPGMAERFQRALRKALNTPPKHQTSPVPKPKEHPSSKGRVHKTQS